MGRITLLLTFGLLFILASTLTAGSMNVEQTPVYNIGIVYSTGGLGDQSFNDMAKQGIDAVIAEYGDTISVHQLCETDCTIPDITNNIYQFASSTTDYDLIIGIGFSASDGIDTAAVDYPDKNFMIIDTIVDRPNVASVTFREHEGSFLAGAMAAMVSRTQYLGFLGGLDIPLINRFGAGYVAGARYINDSIKVEIGYSPDPNNPWGDINGGRTVAQAMMDKGIDIIYSAAGGTGLGVIDAIADANAAANETRYYAIGVDSNQDIISRGNVLTSMIKHVDVAIESQIDAVVEGTWTAGEVSLGLTEDGVGISDMAYTQTEANTAYNSTYTRIELIERLKNLIISGSISVPSSYNQIPEPSQYETITISSLGEELSFVPTEIKLQKNTTYKITFDNPSTTFHHNLRINVNQNLISSNLDDPDDIVIGPNNDQNEVYSHSWSTMWTTPNEDTVIIYFCGYAGHYTAGEKGRFIIGKGTPPIDENSTVLPTTQNTSGNEGVTPTVQFDFQPVPVLLAVLLPFYFRRRRT